MQTMSLAGLGRKHGIGRVSKIGGNNSLCLTLACMAHCMEIITVGMIIVEVGGLLMVIIVCVLIMGKSEERDVEVRNGRSSTVGPLP